MIRDLSSQLPCVVLCDSYAIFPGVNVAPWHMKRREESGPHCAWRNNPLALASENYAHGLRLFSSPFFFFPSSKR